MIASSIKKNIMLLVVLIGSVLAKTSGGDCAIAIDILKDLKMYKKPAPDDEKLEKGFECCKQKGVTCNKKKKPPTVTELEWDNRDIERIPNLIGNLTNLEKL